MKQHSLASVILVVTGITLLVVHDALVLAYFIYCCITTNNSIEWIILWSIAVFFTAGTINFLVIAIIKDLLNK